MRTVLLITSTIKVRPGTRYVSKMKDESKRIIDYKRALRTIAEESNGITDIVFADNSDYTKEEILEILDLGDLFETKKIPFNIITIPNNGSIHKGSGEKELVVAGINYIRENIGSEDVFVIKMTGRLNIHHLDTSLFDKSKLYIPHNYPESDFSNVFDYLTFIYAGPIEIMGQMADGLSKFKSLNIIYELVFQKVLASLNIVPEDFPYFEITDTVIAAIGRPYKLRKLDTVPDEG